MQNSYKFSFKLAAFLMLALPFAVGAEETSRSSVRETTDKSSVAPREPREPREPKEPSSDYVVIEVVYGSAFPGQIQVRDNVCTEFTDIECKKADITVNSEECKQDASSKECKEAKALLDSKFCLKGLIYDGRMSRGEKLALKPCKSYAGFGNVSVRNTSNGPSWTTYSLLSDKARIAYP